ncbi:HAMP domain-containing sensor histidine kinase [Zhihengliuella sp.]|uniref:sensor histidine kinase n=1 Tax=Zhihengliuella sp. TaxID=1954483 RepID=UPI0028119AE5|nr:HAMP domain-containing sensor histidine kinase [Zhihengliuella sp.]
MSLRSRMLLALLGMLALVCLVIGVVTYSAMSSQLHHRLDQDVAQAAERSASHLSQSGTADPLRAPGQASGTLSFLLVDDRLGVGGVLDSTTGERRTVSALSPGDAEALLRTPPDGRARTLQLSLGGYRVIALEVRGTTLVTGLPTAPVQSTLGQLAWTITLVAASGLVATGLVGSLIVRRSLEPLERVAAVADGAARLPLEAGRVELAERVRAVDATPGTEAGTMGAALNRLLDNVTSALQARQETEERLRRFVGDASHELRTPLAAIRGYAELVGATEHLSDDGRSGLDRVVEQSRRMGALVDDLLLLARLDAARDGSVAPAPVEDVDLSRLAAEETADFRVAAPGHRWRLELAPEPVLVHGNAAQLRQVFVNLLSNARKHTPDGTEVTVSLRTSGAGADGTTAVLTVADDGPGIPADFLPHVFERFARADAARSGGEGTTGLGLPIVQAIVEAHGGSIFVDSRTADAPDAAGRGWTRFEARLPLT